MKIIDIKGKSQADPYVIKSGGKFYLYCTGIEGVECYESDRLKDGWTYAGTVLKTEGQKEYWAPSVIEEDGKFYMYYSSMPEDTEDVHLQNIKVAVSDRAAGDFVFVKDLLPPFSIDAHVVRNECGLFMFYCVNDYDGERAGTYIVCDKMTDLLTMAGEPRATVVPTSDEEIFERDRFKKGQHWHTVEGAFYFKKDGYHYCMYSGNCYMKPSYHIGYAVCKSASGELNKLDFVKAEKPGVFAPLITADGRETSTGHNSVIEDGGVLYAVYHGRDYENGGFSKYRTARICRLYAENGILGAEKI